MYGLDNNAISFLRSHLTNRFQRCKITNSFSEWAKISARFSRGSILRPLLFNIFMNDIFLFLQQYDLTKYAEESEKRLSTIIDSLRYEFTTISKRFYNNFMVLNPKEMQIHCKPTWCVMIKFLKTQNNKNNKLNFATHSLNITKNGNKKFNVY